MTDNDKYVIIEEQITKWIDLCYNIKDAVAEIRSRPLSDHDAEIRNEVLDKLTEKLIDEMIPDGTEFAKFKRALHLYCNRNPARRAMTDKYHPVTKEELGEVIDITEDMCLTKGWTDDIFPLAKKRMELTNKILSHPLTTELQRDIPSSKELILLATHDFKNREERKRIHDQPSWTSGWITGFLSERKPNWTKEHDTAIAAQEREKVLQAIHKKTFLMRHQASSLEVNNGAFVLDCATFYELLQSLRGA